MRVKRIVKQEFKYEKLKMKREQQLEDDRKAREAELTKLQNKTIQAQSRMEALGKRGVIRRAPKRGR